MKIDQDLCRRLKHWVAAPLVGLAFGLAALGAGVPTTPATYAVGDLVQVEERGTWYKSTILKVEGDKYLIHYESYSSSSDVQVGADRIRLKEPPVERAPAQGGETTLDGLYLQVQTWMSGGRLSISFQHYWFRPGGSIYFGVPPGGLAKPGDFSVLQERDPKNCGTYGVAGHKLTLQRNGAKAATFDLSVEGDGAVLHFSGPGAVRVGRFKDKQILEGNYEGGSSAAGGGVFVSASDNFHFHQNGTFESGRVVAFDSTGDRTTAAGGSEKSNQGRYQLSGNTLQLAYLDGKSDSFTVYPYPEKDEFPPQHMGINGQMYKLR